jgi:hypothetical protein
VLEVRLGEAQTAGCMVARHACWLLLLCKRTVLCCWWCCCFLLPLHWAPPTLTLPIFVMKAVTSFAMISCDVTSLATCCNAEAGPCQLYAQAQSCCSQATLHSVLQTALLAHALLCRSAAAVWGKPAYPKLLPHLFDESMCQHSQGALSCCSAALHSSSNRGQALLSVCCCCGAKA